MDQIEISLFPIPGSVSLPFSVVPLHVFEPRYRKMIKDSVENKRRIGVSHTIRVVSAGKLDSGASIEDQLNSNQETYEAYPIFSAGYAEILETLPDGRLIVQVTMDARYEIVEELQQIPYKVVRCKPFQDIIGDESLVAIEKLRRHLDQLFIDLATSSANKEVMENFIKSEQWQRQPMDVYSFAIYSLVLFEPDILQRVLELQSTSARISFLVDKLSETFLQ
jgi:Lon protease-like protein